MAAAAESVSLLSLDPSIKHCRSAAFYRDFVGTLPIPGGVTDGVYQRNVFEPLRNGTREIDTRLAVKPPDDTGIGGSKTGARRRATESLGTDLLFNRSRSTSSAPHLN
jgi:hypothetical protein